jgi:hypothetical protein
MARVANFLFDEEGRLMNTDHKSPKPKSAAPGAGESRPPRAAAHALSLCAEPPRAAAAERNPDPYNTSGSFDRTKNWARVGRR